MSLSALSDFLQSLIYLAHMQQVDRDLSRKIFGAVNRAIGGSGKQLGDEELGLAVAEAILEEVAPATSVPYPDRLQEFFNRDYAAAGDPLRFGRLAATLGSNVSVDQADSFNASDLIRPELAARLLGASPKDPPLENTPWEDLSRADRSLVLLKKSLDLHFGGRGYCALVRLLPHFPQPFLVLGNMSGNKVAVPKELLSGPSRRAPEIGAWYVLLPSKRQAFNAQKTNRQCLLGPVSPLPCRLTSVQGIGPNERVRARQLRSLGFGVIRCAESDLGQVWDGRKATAHAASVSRPSPKLVGLIDQVYAGVKLKELEE